MKTTEVKVVKDSMYWANLSKEKHGIELKKSNSGTSTFSILREELKKENSCQNEFMFNLLNSLVEKKVTIDKKKIDKLLGNMKTYLRHPENDSYNYSDWKLIETNEQFQMVKR